MRPTIPRGRGGETAPPLARGCERPTVGPRGRPGLGRTVSLLRRSRHATQTPQSAPAPLAPCAGTAGARPPRGRPVGGRGRRLGGGGRAPAGRPGRVRAALPGRRGRGPHRRPVLGGSRPVGPVVALTGRSRGRPFARCCQEEKPQTGLANTGSAADATCELRPVTIQIGN